MISTGTMSARGRRALSTLIVVALLTFSAWQLPLESARARIGGEPLSANEFLPFQAIAPYLSSTAWLLVTGQDPRLLSAESRADTSQAAPGLTRSPSPLFSRNVLVTRDVGPTGLSSNPSIAADPLDPKHLVLAVIDYDLPSIATYVTLDGGATWDGPRQVRFFAQDILAGGAADLSFDRQGNLFLTSISIGVEDLQIGSSVSPVAVPNVIVSKSDDGGYTWSDATVIAGSSVETTMFPDAAGNEQTGVTFEFLDSPSIAVGPDPEEPDRDLIYVAYTDLDVHSSTFAPIEPQLLTTISSESTIRMVRSTDGGQSWSDPVSVSPTMMQSHLTFDESGPLGSGDAQGPVATQPGSTVSGTSLSDQPPSTISNNENQPEDVVQGANAAVMPDGTLVVAFLDTTQDGAQRGLGMVIVAVSKDGGLSFTEPVQAGIFREIEQVPRNANFHYWSSSFPQLAVGAKDEMYIAVTAQSDERPTDDGDIVLLRSVDRGDTWEAPLRLNADDTDHLQFFPAIIVGPEGAVHAMWGDMRNDPDEVRYDIYYSESTDEGTHWSVRNASDVRATDYASNSLAGFAGGRFLGDHFATAASPNDIYLVWADTRLGDLHAPSQQIGFARREPLLPPSLLVSPASGVAGIDLKLKGTGFQPMSSVSVLLGSTTLAMMHTDEQGTFESAVSFPVTAAGHREINAVDETGNRAAADFTVTIGFDTIDDRLGVGDAAESSSDFPSATPIPSSQTEP